jgi:polysaccharide biosynthesis/export protein
MTRMNQMALPIRMTFFLATGLSLMAGQNRPTETAPAIPPQASAVGVPTLGPRAQGEASQPSLQQRNPRYRLGRGDSVELNFTFVPAFNQTVAIQPDGFITLRPLGDLHVEGKTMPELTQLLQSEYGKILQKPVFTVELKDFEKAYFIASGQVAHPGKYELRGDTTVAQGIAVAGGFNEKARHSQVLLFRRVSDEWVQVKQLDMKKMLHQANLREDLHLQPGDMLFVPQNFLSKVKAFIPAGRLSLSPSDL